MRARLTLIAAAHPIQVLKLPRQEAEREARKLLAASDWRRSMTLTRLRFREDNSSAYQWQPVAGAAYDSQRK